MRIGRIAFLLAAFYVVLFGGSSYYYQIFTVRVLHHIVMTAFLVGWLLWRVFKGRGLPHTPLNLLIVGVVAVWFASALSSLDPRVSLESLWFPLTHLVIFFIFVDLLQRGKQRLIFETQFLLAAIVVVMAGLQLVSWLFGLGIVPGTQVGWLAVLSPQTPFPLVTPQLFMPLGVSTWLAAYAAPLVLLIAGWALTVRARSFRIVLWILAGSVFVVLSLTFSRGGIISVVSAILVFSVLRLSRRVKFQWLNAQKAAPYLAGLLVLVFLGAGAILLISRNASRSAGDVLRRDLWNTALETARDYPAFGVGPGLFGRAHRQYRNPEYVDDRLSSAHNFYLNTAAETGLVGLGVVAGLGLVVVRTWWGIWRKAEGGRKLRLEAAFAALIGIGVHSLFDMFVITPIALLILLLAAYCITDFGKVIPASRLSRWAAGVLGLVLVGYGIGLVQADRAQFAFNQSIAGNMEQARLAQEIDPALHLYDLQVTYLVAQSYPNLDVAIAEYEQVLSVEPTWDTGWINLAALREQAGQFEEAMNDLEKAFLINHANSAAWNWARIADEHGLADENAIIDDYVAALRRHNAPGLSELWWGTPLRRKAVEIFLANSPVDIQYRVYAVYNPQKAYTLVPREPATAADWWVKGEYELTVERNPVSAIEAFGNAINQAQTDGDLYASRARAAIAAQDVQLARRDLDIAQLLITRWEYPNAIRVAISTSPEEIHRQRVDALPARSLDQNFEGVLFVGRVAGFDIASSMRLPGPGNAAMQPWYDLADEYLGQGQIEKAINVYRAIVDYAPEETLAHEQLSQMNSSGQGT